MTIIEALSKIIKDNNWEILNNPRMIIALISDYVVGFEKEKKFLKIASANGVFELIYEMSKSSSDEEKTILKVKAVHKLETEALISNENAEMIVDLILNGVGLIDSPLDESGDITDHWVQYNIGYQLEFGTNGVQNLEKAVEWYTKSAEQGNAWSQNRLGDCYFRGNGVELDYTKAAQWYLKSANQGDFSAQYMLGLCYSNGYGVDKNEIEAFKWYLLSAEQGHQWAQYAVGFAFEFGTSGEQNYKKAVEWYRKSAEQGNAWSQNRLGECYLNGNGTQKDLREAKKWFKLAAEQGDETAKQNLISYIN